MKRFYLPTEIVTGAGTFKELGAYAAQYGKRAMLVCGGKSLRSTGRLDHILDLLRAAGLTTTLYDAVTGEPTLNLIQAGLEHGKIDAAMLTAGSSDPEEP